MKTKTLTQSRGYDMFRDYDRGPWICSAALRRKIDIPPDLRTIRLCLTKTEPENDGWFEMNFYNFDTPLKGIRSLLTHNLKMWLSEGRAEGYRYGYIDYLS